MNMTNMIVLIRPDMTKADVLQAICDQDVGPDEPFVFSAIVSQDKNDKTVRKLKMNCLEPREKNPYTPRDLISLLYKDEKTYFVQPPLEQWLQIFEPMLMKMVTDVHPYYQKLMPNRDELISSLYIAIFNLYTKGYYLHKTIIYKTFVNELNLECRELKRLPSSIDEPIGKDDENKDISLLDQLADTSDEERAEQEYWEELFLALKARMLEDMSEFAFDRILIQLKTKTVDRSTSYKLDKYRQIFNPDYVPRPEAKGKNRGGKKV